MKSKQAQYVVSIILISAMSFVSDRRLQAQSTSVTAQELPSASADEVGMSEVKLAKVIPSLQQLVDEEEIPGAIVMVARHGKVVLHEAVGWRDVEEKKPMRTDSILRFYSMTKAITSVCTMTLVEEGKITLDDPVSRHIPEFAGLGVFTQQVDGELKQVEAKREMTIRDLLRHTSGLTYGFFADSPVDQAYVRVNVLDDSQPLKRMIEKLSDLPLRYQPGTRFNYSVSTDVLGHLIEVVSGQDLDEFFQQRVFQPLDMHDTAFHVAPEKLDRFANTYGLRQNTEGIKVVDHADDSKFGRPLALLSGGGGLVSTARDYMRFCQMLLNDGKLGEVRILKASTVREMTTNQLPESAYPLTLNGAREGVGFGLGFSVVIEKTDWTQHCHLGEYGWGGAASTHYWISPQDDLAVVVLTQKIPFTFQLENLVKPLVYDAIEQ
tara:strand:- start:617515 stop:618822 length:1308 start_codon:yes stop_codon:yes gene_type:complete